DHRTRAGTGGIARRWTDLPFPLSVGWDVSGTVAACGPEVTGFAVGDEVFGFTGSPAPGGCYAEYVAAPVGDLARQPRTADHVQSAAVPLACLTAWQALFDTGAIAPGQRVLVHAAAGGVGHFAVQLARWRGAEVIATASGRNEAFVRALGAGGFVDYTTQRF